MKKDPSKFAKVRAPLKAIEIPTVNGEVLLGYALILPDISNFYAMFSETICEQIIDTHKLVGISIEELRLYFDEIFSGYQAEDFRTPRSKTQEMERKILQLDLITEISELVATAVPLLELLKSSQMEIDEYDYLGDRNFLNNYIRNTRLLGIALTEYYEAEKIEARPRTKTHINALFAELSDFYLEHINFAPTTTTSRTIFIEQVVCMSKIDIHAPDTNKVYDYIRKRSPKIEQKGL
jgi:hypothetical protein